MDLFALLDELQTIARNGLNYARDPFDRQRYERLLDLVSRQYEGALDLPAPEVRKRFSNELGYITPKVGSEAAVFDGEGRILLVHRADDGTWCLPCGWVDPNESPADAAVREAREETGLDVRIIRLIDIFTRKPSLNLGPHTAIAILYLCEVVGGSIRGSFEGPEVRYWKIEEVPVWHELHDRYALAARDAYNDHLGRSRV